MKSKSNRPRVEGVDELTQLLIQLTSSDTAAAVKSEMTDAIQSLKNETKESINAFRQETRELVLQLYGNHHEEVKDAINAAKKALQASEKHQLEIAGMREKVDGIYAQVIKIGIAFAALGSIATWIVMQIWGSMR